MKATVIKRLQRLETTFLRSAAPEHLGPSGAEQITEWLLRKGIVRRETESLAETLARVFGVSMRELRNLLQNRAASLPAE